MNKDIYSILNSTKEQDAESGVQLSDTEVNDLMKRFRERNNTKRSGGKKINKRIIFILAAAAVAATIVPTSVYAYNRYKAQISKTAKYRNTITIEASDNDTNTDQDQDQNQNKKQNQRIDWDMQLMNYEFGWLPEGFAISERSGKYENGDDCITPIFYLLPKNVNTEINMPWSADSETYESNGKTAMINYRVSYMNGEPGNFGREMFVLFDDTDYMLQIYLTDGISKEETNKLIDNIKLVPTDEVRFSVYDEERRKGSSSNLPKEHAVDLSKCDIYHAGDTIHYKNPVTDEITGFMDEHELRINSIELTDSFDGIDTDGIGNEADYSELQDENGNIIENTRQYIKRGDGIETLDEIVKEEKVPVHILKMNVTYTNLSSEKNEIGISPDLIRLKDGIPTGLNQVYDPETDTQYYDSVREHKNEGHFALKVLDGEKGGKNAVILEAGESAEVELAFMVADDELNDLYAKFLSSGGSNYSYAMENGLCPVIEIKP